METPKNWAEVHELYMRSCDNEPDQNTLAYFAALRQLGRQSVVHCLAPLLPRPVIPAWLQTEHYTTALAHTRHSAKFVNFVLPLRRGLRELMAGKGRQEYLIQERALDGFLAIEKVDGKEVPVQKNHMVMKEQLAHILQHIDASPEITVRVLPNEPLSSLIQELNARAHTTEARKVEKYGSIEVFSPSETSDAGRSAFFVPTASGSQLYVASASETSEAERIIKDARATALSQADSRLCIERVLEQLNA